MRNISLIVLMVFLMGCATGYHKASFTGGFDEMKIQDDVFKVSFSGNAYTGSEKTKNFTLLRSAEVALENGYKFFIILDDNTSVSTSSYTTPVTANTTGTAYSYGNVANYSGTTSYSGGQTYYYNKPSSVNTIKCFKEKPENINGLVYDAEQIKFNLRASYKLDDIKKNNSKTSDVNKGIETKQNFSSK